MINNLKMNLGPDGSLKKIACFLKQTNNIAIISLPDKLKSSLAPFYKLISVGAEERYESDESESSGDDIKTDASKLSKTIGKNSADIVKKPASDDEKNNISSQSTRNSTDSQYNTHRTQKHTNNRPPQFLQGNRSYSNQKQRYSGGRSYNNLDRHLRNKMIPLPVRDISHWQHQIPDSLLINNVPNAINLIKDSPMVLHNTPQIVPPVLNSSCDKQGLLGNFPFEELQHNRMHINLGSAIDQQYGASHQTHRDAFLNGNHNYYEGASQNEYWPESEYADNYQEFAPGRPLDHSDFQNPGPSHRSFNPNNNFKRPIPPNRPFNISSNYQRTGIDGPPINISSSYPRTDIDGPINHFNNFQGSGPERDIDTYSYPNPNLDAPSNHSNVQRPEHSNVRRLQRYQSHGPRINDQLNNYVKPDPVAKGFDFNRLGGGTYNLKRNSPKRGFYAKRYHKKDSWRPMEEKRKTIRDEVKEQTVKEAGPGHFSYDY